MIKHGIDISEWQESVNFEKLKQEVDFVIIRAGYGKENNQVDKRFNENYTKAKAAGIPLGTYWYSYATSITEAAQEARVFLKTIENKQFEYPVYFDIEDNSQKKLDRQLLTDIVKTFCSMVEGAGYYVGIYASVDWFDNILLKDQLTRYDKWLAHWTDMPKYGPEFGGLWQYTQR